MSLVSSIPYNNLYHNFSPIEGVNYVERRFGLTLFIFWGHSPLGGLKGGSIKAGRVFVHKTQGGAGGLEFWVYYFSSEKGTCGSFFSAIL